MKYAMTGAVSVSSVVVSNNQGSLVQCLCSISRLQAQGVYDESLFDAQCHIRKYQSVWYLFYCSTDQYLYLCT